MVKIKVAILLRDYAYDQEMAIATSYLRKKISFIELKYFKFKDNKKILNELDDFKPDYIVISTEVHAHWSMEFSFETINFLSSLNTKAKKIATGRLATTASKYLIANFNIDYACIGHREICLEGLFCGEKLQEISGLCYKKNNEIIINPITKQLNFDELPLPDVDEFYKKNFQEAVQYGYYTPNSRGCFYGCTFCQNAAVKEELDQKGKSGFRFYPIKWMINYLEYIKENYGPVKNFYFTDSIFTVNKKYLKDFLNEYKKKINIPFICATRMNLVDDEVAYLLKDSGCSKVNFGIESGNEHTRNNLLKKGETDKHLFDGIQSCKKYKLRTAGNVIIGLPGETFEEAFQSVKKSINLNPNVLNGYIFQPYVGTKLTNYAISEGYLSRDYKNWKVTEGKWSGESALKIDKRINKLSLLVPLFHIIRNDQIIKFLIKIPNNRFFYIIYHLPRIIRSLKYDLKGANFKTKIIYLFKSIYSIFFLRKRPSVQ